VALPDLGVFVAAGPSGIGYSTDRGRTWRTVDTLAAFALHGGRGRAWTAGPTGWIARVDLRALVESLPP
jgi:hypothetical protein